MLSVTAGDVRAGLVHGALRFGAAVLFPIALGFAGAVHAQSPQTVVVVPFVNISGQPADHWFGAGIAETVTTELDQVDGLSVVALNRVDGYGLFEGVGSDEDALRNSARDAGASWVVAGGYQRLGNQLRITARIIDVLAGTAHRTTRVDGQVSELFDLQDRVVEALNQRFREILGRDPTRAADTTPPSVSPPPVVPSPAPDAEDLPPGGEGDIVPRPEGLRGGFVPPGASSAFPDEIGGEAPPVRPTETSGPAAGVRRGGALGSVRPIPEVPTVVVSENQLADPLVTLGPGDVTGTLTIGDDEPRLGVATGAGILSGRPSVRPRRTTSVPLIDGHLDDEVWRNAVHITEFVQLNPLNGAPPTEDTDVYIAYDSSNIYLGFHAHFADPDRLRANRKDRDIRTGDDVFWVYFDPFLDQQRAYSFAVNAYGVQIDAIVSTRGGGGFGGRGGRGGPGSGLPFGDMTWDALFESAGQFVADGFTAEMAIPFKSLRYPQRGPEVSHRWGFQIARRIRAQDETIVWSPVSREVAGFLPQMGVLEGMTGLSTSRNIEILPTFTAIQFGSVNETGAFANDDAEPEGGVNLKYGVTSNLTADATFNPDFSQIESDRPQIELNQRFALFFPELRPFFLEGAEIFRIRTPVTLVHTRTIVDPDYGAKLTGKTGDTTIGVMFANDAAPGEIADTADPAFGKDAKTFVGRLRYDLYSESYVGAIVTNREFVDSHSRVAGLDGQFRLGNTHELGMTAIGTQHRDLDGVDTTGHLFNVFLRKSGRSLGYMVAHYSLSPDFKTDVGFVRRTDQRSTFGQVNYRWWPESWLVNWGPRVNFDRSYNYDGVLEDERARAGANFGFARNINANADISRELERFGGVNFYKTRYRFFGVIAAFRPASFGLGGAGGEQVFYDDDNPYLGDDRGWNAFVNLRLIPQLESRINIDTNRFTDPRNADDLVFDVNIFRALTTYQFTDRFLLRNISEYNSFDKKLGLNFLFTYRVNAGTVFYVGYDDRFQQGDRIEFDPDGDGALVRPFDTMDLTRTNRAIFTKFQYLFRF